MPFKAILALCAALLSGPAAAQEVLTGSGAVLRVLDKLTGLATDVSLSFGETATQGYLRITLNDCRYPATNPSGEAYAAVTVYYRNLTAPIFEGWMLASSPALNAVDHPRYDVWALRCMTS
ncbi:DUF2155 domain-containing protein [Yoonia sp.]|uniref:DUF2155 domain-containing protein n=1 Tax=Yoonia sp. TaxID=2212373 RepID=UPI001A04CCED|nr:DUF2155 domain-containing protein [Yoonia sp.]MBE0414613.1 DUF2155 domain-containing protein [Yoonia sp.]